MVARNTNDSLVAPAVGSGRVCVCRESGVGRAVRYRCVWQESGFSHHCYGFFQKRSLTLLVRMESQLLQIFSAVSCVTFQHINISGTTAHRALISSRAFSLEDSQQISFYRVRLSTSRPTPNLEDQASVFISPGYRVAQLHPWTLGSSGASGSPFPMPTFVGP
jgi:hypothetical protein